jgi:hypothetical protein
MVNSVSHRHFTLDNATSLWMRRSKWLGSKMLYLLMMASNTLRMACLLQSMSGRMKLMSATEYDSYTAYHVYHVFFEALAVAP